MHDQIQPHQPPPEQQITAKKPVERAGDGSNPFKLPDKPIQFVPLTFLMVSLWLLAWQILGMLDNVFKPGSLIELSLLVVCLVFVAWVAFSSVETGR